MSSLIHLKISAPGKIILHGEHSVVYGKPAIVAVISSRNHLLLKEHTSNEINFYFESFKKHCKIPIEKLNTVLNQLNSKRNLQQDSEICYAQAVEFITNELDYLWADFSEESHKKTILAVIYLLFGIFNHENCRSIKKGFHIELTSEFDPGAGLGSSASFAVCFVTAFLSLLRYNELLENKTLPSEWKEIISEWAFNSEKIMHGKPSGIDNTICTYGGLIKFQKEPRKITSIKWDDSNKLNILLVNSKVSRSTANMVQKVTELYQKFPSIIEHVFNAVEAIVEDATELYENFSSNDVVIFDKIKKLFEINNNLLRTIDVSHEKLDQITSIASQLNYSSKITGAGGGGYMIILLPDNYKNSKNFEELCDNLKQNGFECTEAVVGGKGVTVEILSSIA